MSPPSTPHKTCGCGVPRARGEPDETRLDELGTQCSPCTREFACDVANLCKAELTIPFAFSSHALPNPEVTARRSFRDGLRLSKLMQCIVGDVDLRSGKWDLVHFS